MSSTMTPSMQFPMGPACIFLRKGIAEKQRVRLGAVGKDGGKGKGSWDVGKRRVVTGTVEEGSWGVDLGGDHELRRLEGARWGHVGQGGEHEIRSQD